MNIQETIDFVKKNMLGRIAEEANNTALMAATAMCDGNHLEIGSLHGGSAIVVALLKKYHGFTGSVVCIDPLDGYYPCKPFYKQVDPRTKVPVSLETIQENMQRFGVDLEIVRAYSIPFPIVGRTFATAYIDGDHDGDAPLKDFENASMVTTKFITFDNCDKKHPAVWDACAKAEKLWKPYKRAGIACIVEHP